MSKALLALESFRQLPVNWDSYGGDQINPLIIDAATGWLSKLPRAMREKAFVAPMSNGCVQVEWDQSNRHVEVEFLTTDKVGVLIEETDVDSRESTMSDWEGPLYDPRVHRAIEWVVR